MTPPNDPLWNFVRLSYLRAFIAAPQAYTGRHRPIDVITGEPFKPGWHPQGQQTYQTPTGDTLVLTWWWVDTPTTTDRRKAILGFTFHLLDRDNRAWNLGSVPKNEVNPYLVPKPRINRQGSRRPPLRTPLRIRSQYPRLSIQDVGKCYLVLASCIPQEWGPLLVTQALLEAPV